ncbi:MAG: AMIN domain-containing protein [Nostocaceae cyanobacterium]|nr:AMIN domain-containing protein [Nostocaceae cyanobacterium]
MNHQLSKNLELSSKVKDKNRFFGFYLLPFTLFTSTAIPVVATSYAIAAQPTATLQDWSFDPNSLQLMITLNQSTTQPRYFLLSQPSRLVVDLPDTQLGRVPTQQNFSGVVTQVRVSQFQAGITRIVLDLAPEVVIDPVQVQLQPISVRNPVRWVLRPAIATANTTQVPTTTKVSPLPTSVPTATTTTLPSTLPPAIFDNQQPVVTVPPLNSNNTNPSPISRNNRPTANFPQPSSLSRPPVSQSGEVLVPTVTRPQPSTTDVPVIEFGQPLPE